MVALAVVIVLLVIGSLIFHFASSSLGWYFTPLASNWDTIDFTVDITFWVCGIVFVAVNLFTAYCVWRFRARARQQGPLRARERQARDRADGVHDGRRRRDADAGAVRLGGFRPACPRTRRPSKPSASNGTGASGCRARTTCSANSDVRHMSVDNPLGVDPEDPTGQDDIIIASPILHLPVDQSVRTLAAFDRRAAQLHGAAIPREDGPRPRPRHLPMVHADGAGHLRDPLRGALRHGALRDARQGRRRRAGRLSGVAREAADVCADAGAARRQRHRGAAPTTRCARRATARRARATRSSNAPKLAGLEPWYARRQLQHYQTGVRGTAPGDQFGPQMAPMSQLVVDPATRENVLAYIETLPNTPSPRDRERRRRRARPRRSTSPARRATAPKGRAVGAPTRRGSPA